MAKYFGFFKPWGFKQNCFQFFYTSNPIKHFDSIYKRHTHIDETIDEIAALNGHHFNTVLLYSQKTYPIKDYRNCIRGLEWSGNTVIYGRDSNNIWYWPLITFNNRDVKKLNNVDNMIEQLSKEIKKVN